VLIIDLRCTSRHDVDTLYVHNVIRLPIELSDQYIARAHIVRRGGTFQECRWNNAAHHVSSDMTRLGPCVQRDGASGSRLSTRWTWQKGLLTTHVAKCRMQKPVQIVAAVDHHLLALLSAMNTATAPSATYGDVWHQVTDRWPRETSSSEEYTSPCVLKSGRKRTQHAHLRSHVSDEDAHIVYAA
jgi:hypothetical protein